MKAKLIILATVGMAFLTACSVKTPFGGKLENGGTISGFATEGPSGGTIALKIEAGESCNGDYETRTDTTELTIQITCDNGKTGTVRMSRKKDIQHVWSTIELSDGRMGTLDFNQDE